MNKKIFWIVEERPLPTTDYYVIPFLEYIRKRYQNIFYYRVNNPSAIDFQEKAEVNIIFVRYLTLKWKKHVENNRKNISRIYYLMDDDLFDISAWSGLPLRYCLRLFRKAYIWKNWLRKVGAIFLFSNDYLANKYKEFNPIVLPPFPIFECDLKKADFTGRSSDLHKKKTILFYFASSSHKNEFTWLRSIIEKIVQLCDKILIELIADRSVYRIYRDIPNIVFHYPLSWTTYRNFLVMTTRDIGLAPILDRPFNQARSFVKFYEITACGAVGIYSASSQFSKIITHSDDGLLVPNEPGNWIDAIVFLAENEEQRKRMFQRALAKLSTIKRSVELKYKEIAERFLYESTS